VDRLVVGLTLMAVAPLTWLFGVFGEGATQYVVPVILQAIGLGLAAWGMSTYRAAAAWTGFTLAGLGMLLFYDAALFANLPAFAGLVFIVGCALCALASSLVAFPLLAGGLFTIAASGVLWVFADAALGGWIWQPGNLLALGGSVLAALGARDLG
jgi:hypothetical protein